MSIKVTSTGKEIVSLDDYKLSSASEGFETTYPFSSTTKSEEGATLVVWSSKWDVEHRPKDGQFVMKEERLLWFAGHETPGGKMIETVAEIVIMDAGDKVN